jgi:hypothetical protein
MINNFTIRLQKIKRFIFFSFAIISQTVLATNYYVSTKGSDSNTGKSTSVPFLTVKYAVSVATAGDTIFVRGGTYTCAATISISKSGTSTSRLCLFVYPGDTRPILDFSSMALSSSNRGINFSGNYWHVKGIRIKGAGDNGMNMTGSYNILEFCDFYENRDGGCQLGGGASYNKIINCDSYCNADYVSGSSTSDGGNADGFSPKLDVGTNNYYYGCRSWRNSDDGWDGYLRGADDVTTYLENCWTWGNGYYWGDGATTSSMNGNGFKLGGSDSKNLAHNFIVKNCLAFYNKANGFDQNSNVGSETLYNCTSVGNTGKSYYFSSSVTLATGKVFTVENCIAYNNTSNSFRSGTVLATNNFATTSAQFLSVDTTGISGERNSDGSLPRLNFMRLTSTSTLIDVGTIIDGVPYVGTAPDLGCFEYVYSDGIYYKVTLSSSTGGTATQFGSGSYLCGSLVTLSATAATNYNFSNFKSGSTSLSTSTPYAFYIQKDTSITANFKIKRYKVDFEAGSNGTISPSGTDSLDINTSVTVTATPSSGYKFANFTSGSTTLSTSNPYQFTVTADSTITANFEQETKVNEISENTGLLLFVTSDDLLRITSTDESVTSLSVSIISSSGAPLINKLLSGTGKEFFINISNLPQGLYICKIFMNGRYYAGKFIKQ